MNNNLKLFGLRPEKGRWFFIILGLLIYICLGSVYSWSIFRKPLENLFNIGATKSSMPYMIFLVFFSFFMPISGNFLDKYGPKLVIATGGFFVGIGWILSSFAKNITMINLFYGVIGGAGVGIAYGGPIAIATKWFPEKRGFAVGLIVIGFGLSPLITAPFSKMLIDMFGPLKTFLFLGLIFLFTIVLLALLMKFPPSNWNVNNGNFLNNDLDNNFNISEMLKSSSFYALWICYAIGTTSGLMAIGISSPVGEEIIKISSNISALAVSIFAIFNGLGRPIFGWLTDKISSKYTAIISFIITFLASIGMINAGEGKIILYLICFICFWLCLGGWLAIAPATTANFYSTRNYSKKYGFVYTAYGFGAIIGNLISGKAKDIFGSYIYTFYPIAILSIFGILISFLLLNKPSIKKN